MPVDVCARQGRARAHTHTHAPDHDTHARRHLARRVDDRNIGQFWLQTTQISAGVCNKRMQRGGRSGAARRVRARVAVRGGCKERRVCQIRSLE